MSALFIFQHNILSSKYVMRNFYTRVVTALTNITWIYIRFWKNAHSFWFNQKYDTVRTHCRAIKIRFHSLFVDFSNKFFSHNCGNSADSSVNNLQPLINTLFLFFFNKMSLRWKSNYCLLWKLRRQAIHIYARQTLTWYYCCNRCNNIITVVCENASRLLLTMLTY